MASNFPPPPPPPQPDWQFMEGYTKQKEQQKIQEFMEQLSDKALEQLISGRLTDREWKEFKIMDLFEIYTGALLSSDIIENGSIPRITATDNTNGIALFTNDINHKNFRVLENFISISFLGSVFYHPYKASLDMKIHAIKGKSIELNKYNSAFLIRVIKQFAEKYAYGNQLSISILKQQKIMLPINKNETPDWEFMETFMRKIEEDKVKNILEYYQNNAKISLGKVNDNNILSDWREFFIGGKEGIFDIKATQSGIDKNKLNSDIGNIPYITRSEVDNGINLFVSDKQNEKYKKDKSNVITIGLDTQTIFYQQNAFYTGQNIQILSNDNLNRYIAMFIIPLLKTQMKKFSWGGNGATLGRLNRTKILLPTKNNQIDWKGMEQYIREKELEKIIELLKYYQ